GRSTDRGPVVTASYSTGTSQTGHTVHPLDWRLVMIESKVARGVMIGTALTAGLAVASVTGGAQTKGTPERFSALAVNMSNIGRAGAQTLEIVFNRWSTDAERDRLMTALLDLGPAQLLNTVHKLPRFGSFRTLTSMGHDIHYARHTALPDGGERVFALTDRYVSFWEEANQTRSVDYPFTTIDLQVAPNGEGQGKMSFATKITGDAENKIVVIEGFADQPIQLNAVKREKS